jgi:hypothetical protein
VKMPIHNQGHFSLYFVHPPHIQQTQNEKDTVYFTLFALSLAACVPAFTPTIEAHESGRKWNTPPSLDSQTDSDAAAGFALEYPVGWTVKETVVGERGSQVVLLSSPEIADIATLPDGATGVTVTVNQWDPKNDLAAFVANQKTAWEASEFTITEEESIKLDLGMDAVRVMAQTPDGLTSAGSSLPLATNTSLSVAKLISTSTANSLPPKLSPAMKCVIDSSTIAGIGS